MAITKADAQAAIKALIACNAGEMFGKIRGNQHSMEKHFSKGSAYKAADETGYPQGYFKRGEHMRFDTKEDFQRKVISGKTRTAALLAVNARNPAEFEKKAGGETVIVTQKSAASKDDILGIVTAVIASRACELRKASSNDQTRFLAVSPMPRGFYGRSIDKDEKKAKDCDNAVVVINAQSTTNPQIVTIFPADNEYVGKHNLLT